MTEIEAKKQLTKLLTDFAKRNKDMTITVSKFPDSTYESEILYGKDSLVVFKKKKSLAAVYSSLKAFIK